MRIYKRTTTAEMVAIRDKSGRKKQKNWQKTKESVQKIKNNINTVKTKYPEYKESYNYVDNLFPCSNVKKVIIYKARHKLMEMMGFGAAGGFYDSISKVVIFSNAPVSSRQYQNNKYIIRAKIKNDEVIVHELLHYCYFEEKKKTISTEIKEEFAYGWSLGYLRSKGYSDEEIIEYNYLPFLYQIERKNVFNFVLSRENVSPEEYNNYPNFKKNNFVKKFQKEIHERAKKLAIKRGRKLIYLYNKKLEEGSISNKPGIMPTNFSFMDIE